VVLPPDSKRNGDREKTAEAERLMDRIPRVPRTVPAFYKRRKKRGNEIGQVLLQMGAMVTDVTLASNSVTTLAWK